MAERPPHRLRIELSETDLKAIVEAARPPKRRSYTGISIFVTALLAITGYFVTWSLDYVDLQEQEIKAKIAKKIEIYRLVIDAVVGVRAARLQLLLDCNYRPQFALTNKFKQMAKRERLDAEFALIKVNSATLHIFGESVREQIHQFNVWDEKNSDPCEYLEDAYREKQLEIQRLMNVSIAADEEQLFNSFMPFSSLGKKNNK